MEPGRSSRGGLGIGAALTAQVALLARIAGLDAGGVAATVAIGVIGAATLIPAALRRAPEATVMLAAGGLGMTAGWWADLGFTTAAAVAAHAREPLDLVWCRSPAGPASLASLPGLRHISWMNLGMLAFGMPAVAAARRRGARDDAHGIAALIACAAAMSIGMSAGTRAAAALTPGARRLGRGRRRLGAHERRHAGGHGRSRAGAPMDGADPAQAPYRVGSSVVNGVRVESGRFCAPPSAA